MRILRYLALFFIGIANSLPLPAMGGTLSIRLAELGVHKETIGLLALFGIPMSLKLLWTPLIDRYALPFFRNSQRKGWIVFSLMGMSASLWGMSFIDPVNNLWPLSACIFSLSLFTGCLYIAGIAYELESLESNQYTIGSANVIAGYRVGLILGGGGAIYLSAILNWSLTYQCLSFVLLAGSLLVLLLPEPIKSKEVIDLKKQKIMQYPSLLHWFWREIIVDPCMSFVKRSNWVLILVMLLFFKAGDEFSKCMEGPFYLSLGFTKMELATAAKFWGMASTIFGAFLGGILLKSKDSFLTVIKMGFLHACTLSCYYFMTLLDKSLPALYFTVALEHMTSGLLMTAFTAFLWKQCDKEYAPIQYAIYWSIISLKTDLFSCLGGFIASQCEWGTFFLIVIFFGIFSAMLPLAFFLILKNNLFTLAIKHQEEV